MTLKFSDEAFLTATFLINRLPTSVLANASPLEKLFDTKPVYTFLRTFGCTCWPNLRPYNNRKLAFQSKQCAFIGYSLHHKGYKCLDISTGSVYISCDVVFGESVFPFSKLHSNAGARFRSEISLLLSSFLDHTSFGGTTVDLDHVPKSTNPPMQSCPLQESQHALDHLIVSPGDPYFLTCDVEHQAMDPAPVGNPGVTIRVDTPGRLAPISTSDPVSGISSDPMSLS
jgi:hypothetical protein